MSPTTHSPPRPPHPPGSLALRPAPSGLPANHESWLPSSRPPRTTQFVHIGLPSPPVCLPRLRHPIAPCDPPARRPAPSRRPSMRQQAPAAPARPTRHIGPSDPTGITRSAAHPACGPRSHSPQELSSPGPGSPAGIRAAHDRCRFTYSYMGGGKSPLNRIPGSDRAVEPVKRAGAHPQPHLPRRPARLVSWSARPPPARLRTRTPGSPQWTCLCLTRPASTPCVAREPRIGIRGLDHDANGASLHAQCEAGGTCAACEPAVRLTPACRAPG